MNNPVTPLFHRICAVFATVFGQVKWKCPPWLIFLGNKAKASPRLFWVSTLMIMLALSFVGYTAYQYHQRPKPMEVTAFIKAPAITPNAETLAPQNLTVDFGIKEQEDFIAQSVAPIDMVGKIVAEGINISPQIEGQWFWNSDNQLVFTPSEDWPANQKYNIHFSNHFFAPSAHLRQFDFTFSTHPFEAKITEFKFYQNPVNADARNAVATIEFNFPVDPDSLENNTQLVFETLKKTTSQNKQNTLAFSYTYDNNKRVAYLHSQNIQIEDVSRYLLLTLDRKITSSTTSGALEKNISQNLLIPDASGFLKVTSVTANMIRNDKDRPEQALTIETSIGVNESNFNQSIHAYVLPADYPATASEPAKPNYQWQNPGEVTENILALATPLKKEAIPSEQNYSTLHGFKFSAPSPRYIYIKINKGMKGIGEFTLTNDYATLIPVPEFPKEISFLHKGSLLALGGEKKLSALIRGVPAVKFEFARVLPANVNQLVTQTQGDFNNPYFINPSFNQQNISQIFSEVQTFDASDPAKQQYTALDLSKYLNNEVNPTGPQGLFLLQATGWDATNNTPLDVKASRMILLTDLGLLVKDNLDGSHDVFVQSITQGTPVANATITVLGKNGLPILSRISDAEGRVNFPSLKDFVEDREPSVYIASLNSDVSFIPFNNSTRQLNYSKFDVGGIYTYNQDSQNLSGYLFSDRGIYRPGDAVHIGMIIKQPFAEAQPPGLPLQVSVIDSRGATIKDEKLILNETGFMSLDFSTPPNAPTGQYLINLYLVKDNQPQNLLGSTTVRVSEFQPDRLSITSTLLPKPVDGWLSPAGLKAKVDLWNLYGAPATNRKVSARILLNPERVQFNKYPDYVFADPLFDPKKPTKVFSDTLKDSKTNDQGVAEFDLNLERFEKATYQLTFFAEGFEAEGGRGVTTQTKTLVSPLPYFIGYKADGDLTFIKQNDARKIHYIAINPQLGTEEISALRIQLTALHPVTTLVKKPDGTYQYQSTIQSSILNTSDLTINSSGTNYHLPTQQIGDYQLTVLGKGDTVLSQLKYRVVGASQTPLAKNAELSAQLNKTEYPAGEDIELQITAPYTGSGLITIERDKIYATQWFKTETTNSIQKIKIPDDFQGNGYVNIAFVRDWNSPELFISPLSYSVQPFEVSHESHDIAIDLKTPKTSRPGEPVTMSYHSDKPGKIVVFAVDEGILQVANYDVPNPLAFFFQKHALEVLTQQTVDQILPQFIQDRELSIVGGDEGEAALAGKLNPFKRKTDLPVVYWSGILDTDSTTRQLTYQVPDYFNGSLKIMAVAVSTDSVGSQESTTQIKGDLIINPNTPTFVTPGDQFTVSASVANQIKDSGEHAQITVNLSVSPEIELLSEPKQTLEISEGRERPIQFQLRATKTLGSATIHFQASSGDKSGKISTTLSVRPATPYSTQINSGKSDEKRVSLNLNRDLYPQYHKASATMSSSPLILLFGLQRYLDEFPYGCTEQLTSKALPLLALNNQTWIEKDDHQLNEKINTTIQMLGQRQMSHGGFSYWPGFSANDSNHFASVYAMHFLTEAKAQGFNVPGDLFYNGISYLKELASQNPSSIDSARIAAYAIYILTRNEIVTTNYLTNLQLYLQKNQPTIWKNDITAIYIAASYHLLKNFEDANQLLNQYSPSKQQTFTSDFYNQSIIKAQYLYIIAKHFPNKLHEVGHNVLTQLVQDMNDNDINTILSGFASLALSAYSQDASTATAPVFSITQALDNNEEKNIEPNHPNYQQLNLSTDVKHIRFNNPEKQTFFYQLMQSGFANRLPTEPLKQGVEIFREYTNAQGHVLQSTTLGSEIEVHIHTRALNSQYLNHIVIEDLLPAGFEVVQDSVKAEWVDYLDIREDRVNFFGSLGAEAHEIIYKIKATNLGQYVVPPIYAESMYNPLIKASGIASHMMVTPAN